jgi:hypothetical protein
MFDLKKFLTENKHVLNEDGTSPIHVRDMMQRLQKVEDILSTVEEEIRAIPRNKMEPFNPNLLLRPLIDASEKVKIARLNMSNWFSQVRKQ